MLYIHQFIGNSGQVFHAKLLVYNPVVKLAYIGFSCTPSKRRYKRNAEQLNGAYLLASYKRYGTLFQVDESVVPIQYITIAVHYAVVHVALVHQ